MLSMKSSEIVCLTLETIYTCLCNVANLTPDVMDTLKDSIEEMGALDKLEELQNSDNDKVGTPLLVCRRIKKKKILLNSEYFAIIFHRYPFNTFSDCRSTRMRTASSLSSSPTRMECPRTMPETRISLPRSSITSELPLPPRFSSAWLSSRSQLNHNHSFL